MEAGHPRVDTEDMSVQLSHLNQSPTPRAAARTIVAGYDRSPEAHHALAVAAERAGPGGTVVIVHATTPAAAWLDSPFYDDAVAASRREEREVRDELRSLDLGDVRAELEIVDGPAANAILRAAGSVDAAEIVVGSRGLGAIRALLGSVSQDVARHANSPVVIVSPAAVAAAPEGDGWAMRDPAAADRAA
jgi:nucleotide-binding universal stress UspA family protein